MDVDVVVVADDDIAVASRNCADENRLDCSRKWKIVAVDVKKNYKETVAVDDDDVAAVVNN